MLERKTPPFIVVEGPDGCGKTSAISVIKKYLESYWGPDIVTTREPGGSIKAEEIRNVIISTDKLKEDLQPHARTFLFLAARIQHIANTILPNLEKNKIVICDRYLDSTNVLQGIIEDKQRELDYISAFGRFNYLGARPDITIYLTATKQTTDNRLSHRVQDNVEKIWNNVNQNEIWDSYFGQLIREFQHRHGTKANTNGHNGIVIKVNANLDKEGVEKQIKSIVEHICSINFRMTYSYMKTIQLDGCELGV